MAKKKSSNQRPKVKAIYARQRIITEDCDEAREFYNRSRFGSILDGGKVQLSLLEGFYLHEKGKLDIFDGRNKKLNSDEILNKCQRNEKNFWIRYCAFKDMRDKGYIVKTALKFGADFRIYDRGVKPGEDHAKWIMYPVHEKNALTWHEFSAKNRVAHSTKKKLLLAVVDEESDVTYYQVSWVRP